MSDKNRLLTALLCFLFGYLGAHRFYVGRVGSGILQLITFGGLGIWAAIDLIFIVCGEFEDGDGNKIVNWGD